MPLTPPKEIIEKEFPPDADLMLEHSVLRRILGVIHKISESTRVDNKEYLKQALGLFKKFGQSYHEYMEEKYVFPKFNDKKMKEKVKTLVEQHSIGKKLVEEILQDLKNFKNEEDLNHKIHHFCCMYNYHANFEDTEIFPAWRKMMSGIELKEAVEKFESTEEKKISGGIESILKEIEEIEREIGVELEGFNNKTDKGSIGATPTEIATVNDASEIKSDKGNLIETLPPGESAGQRPQSAEEFLRGSSDPLPLSSNGKKEAQEAADYFARNKDRGKIIGIFSGNLLRHVQTAKIISKATGVPVLGASRDLQPWRSGGYEGSPTKEVYEKLLVYMEKKPDVPVPGKGPYSTENGESFNNFVARFIPEIKAALEVANQDDGSVIVVCSFRNVKVMQSFVKAGADWNSCKINKEEMHNRDGEPGSIYLISLSGKTLTMKRIGKNAKEKLQTGVYLVRHGSTPWNEGKLVPLLKKPPEVKL